MRNEVIAVTLKSRNTDAPDIQDIFTSHGCLIKIRLGIHELQGCSNQGLILLVVQGDEDEIASFISELNSHPRVKTSSLKIEPD